MYYLAKALALSVYKKKIFFPSKTDFWHIFFYINIIIYHITKILILIIFNLSIY